MRVVSNTTPISNLIRIHQLPLLAALFGEVWMPEAVARELERGAKFLGAWQDAPGALALRLASPLDGPFLRQLESVLHPGEAAAISLAEETRAELLLMDELDGRHHAAYHAVPLSGTLGVLLKAQQRGLVERLAPLIDALQACNFRIHPDLRRQVLSAAGEGS
jgi:hypothetical protein